MCELFKIPFFVWSSVGLMPSCKILATVPDLPEPVEPTTAMCLLKNLSQG